MSCKTYILRCNSICFKSPDININHELEICKILKSDDQNKIEYNGNKQTAKVVNNSNGQVYDLIVVNEDLGTIYKQYNEVIYLDDHKLVLKD